MARKKQAAPKRDAKTIPQQIARKQLIAQPFPKLAAKSQARREGSGNPRRRRSPARPQVRDQGQEAWPRTPPGRGRVEAPAQNAEADRRRQDRQPGSRQGARTELRVLDRLEVEPEEERGETEREEGRKQRERIEELRDLTGEFAEKKDSRSPIGTR